MPVSPEQNSDGALRVALMSNGNALPETVQLMSLQVQLAVNAIAWARLEINDGDLASGKHEVADGALLAPGAELSISLGYAEAQQEVFTGVVVRMGVRLGRDGSSRLVVEARDKAVAMTLGRRVQVFADKKDSEVLSTLVSGHSLQADVQATDAQHRALVQHDCSDWDFLLARAEANGLLVIAADGKVSIKPPATKGQAAFKVTWGTDLLSFDADVDARTQLSSVEAKAWDPASLAALSASAQAEALGLQGNLDAAALAKVLPGATCVLRSSAALTQAGLTGWAKAQQRKAALARVRGQMRFQGSAKALPGTLLEVAGVGARFNGKVFVSAVRHVVEGGNWTTEAEFGLDPRWLVTREDVLAPPAGALVPGVQGLQLGVVVKLDGDPDSAHRIQVRTPALAADAPPVWARLLMPHASNAFGALFAPEVGDEVLVGHVAGDPAHPVVLGSLYGGKHAPPTALAAGNPIKTVVTRCGHKLEFDDDKKVITLRTPAGNQAVLSDQGKSITLTDQHDNTVTLDASGIKLASPKDIVLDAKGKVTVSAVNNVELTAKADLKASGLNVQCTANVGFKAQGNATAELVASGQTTVKGALVMIN